MSDPLIRELFDHHDTVAEPPLPPRFVESGLRCGRRRVLRRRLVRAVVATCLATVAVAAVATASPAGRHGDRDRATRGNAPPATSATPRPDLPSGPPIDAGTLLRRVSLVAGAKAAEPVRDDQFIYTEYWSHFTELDGEEPGKPHLEQSWESVDGTRPGWGYSEKGKNNRRVEYQIGPFPNPGFIQPTYSFLTTLPTDPVTLEASIREHVSTMTGGKTDAAPGAGYGVFDVINRLLSIALLPPKLGAALYEIAAELPGVKLVPDTVDAAGRHGIAVSLTASDESSTTEWIFDPATYEYRGVRMHINFDGQIQVRDMAVMRVAVVDHVREVPN